MGVTLKNVVVNYGDCLAVNQLSLTIEKGELVSILGPSGCGKTSTLNAIAGLIQISSGQILFDEVDVTKKSPQHRNIGLVFQNYALYPHLTVAKNIAFPLRQNSSFKQAIKLHNQRFWPSLFKKSYRSEINRLVEETATKVGIKDQLHKRPSALSGGQQQRVAIARAVIKKPQVLLLDEPFSNLDVQTRATTREWVKAFQNGTRITTIFVTHDQEEAMSISDRIFVMNRGVLQQEGTPSEIYKTPQNRFVAKFIGSPQMNFFSGFIDSVGQVTYKGVFLGECHQTEWYNQAVFIGVRPEHLIWINTNSQEKPNSYPFRGQLKTVEHWGWTDYIKAQLEDDEVWFINSNQQQPSDLAFLDFKFTPGKIYLFGRTNNEPLIEVI